MLLSVAAPWLAWGGFDPHPSSDEHEERFAGEGLMRRASLSRTLSREAEKPGEKGPGKSDKMSLSRFLSISYTFPFNPFSPPFAAYLPSSTLFLLLFPILELSNLASGKERLSSKQLSLLA